MSTVQDTSIDNFRCDLESISSEWSQIHTAFVGPAPPVPREPSEWAEATELNLILRPTDDVTFAAAFHQTISRIRQLFFDHFASWATQVVDVLGVDRFSIHDIPNPPLNHLPLDCRGTTTAVDWLTGSADTVKAGKRIIFWAAACVHPRAFARPDEFSQYTVFNWTSGLVECLRNENAGGWCVAVRDLMQWVEQGFELLLETNDAEATEESHESPVNGDVPTPAFRMRKVTDRVIEVTFENETGTISGKYAVRLQRLIVQRRIHALELGDDTMVADSRQSTLASVETIEINIDQSVSSNGNTSRRQILDELRPLWARYRELEAEIADATSPIEREELESEKQRLLERINQVRRAESSAVSKSRARVDKGFKRLLEEVQVPMPKFFRHVEMSIEFDELPGEFTYAPEQFPDWGFVGF